MNLARGKVRQELERGGNKYILLQVNLLIYIYYVINFVILTCTLKKEKGRLDVIHQTNQEKKTREVKQLECGLQLLGGKTGFSEAIKVYPNTENIASREI